MNLAVVITERIQAVCPIHGVSLKNLDNKESWRIDFKPNATQEQKEAARAVLRGFDLALEKKILRNRQEILAVEQDCAVSQRFLREALMFVAEQHPAIKNSPGYKKIAEGEAKIKLLR